MIRSRLLEGESYLAVLESIVNVPYIQGQVMDSSLPGWRSMAIRSASKKDAKSKSIASYGTVKGNRCQRFLAIPDGN
ncbi:hypothetical protein IQ235_03620 [Oscillatoriales cyanobacterium LEGE 11467]|uniref:Uncharacterized protein n=1 Tax=Zarconia navalis LEGE 11467 TaxID=1828826 RepID=A0A928Z7V7_9CYAN|nr:hypothetical protein [Zarconia navalis]MBE9039879.1 hypothetical protein [Zarconia navalis LEGE 11467]